MAFQIRTTTTTLSSSLPSMSSSLSTRRRIPGYYFNIHHHQEWSKLSLSSNENGNDNENNNNKQRNKKRKRPNKNRNKKKGGGGKSNNNTNNNSSSNVPYNPTSIETWRFFGIEVHPDSMVPTTTAAAKDIVLDPILLPYRKHLKTTTSEANNNNSGKEAVTEMYLTKPVLMSLLQRLKIKINDNDTTTKLDRLKDIRVIRRSLDARKTRRDGTTGPRYAYVIDVKMTSESVRNQFRLKHQPGRTELMSTTTATASGDEEKKEQTTLDNDSSTTNTTKEKPKVVVVGAGPAGLFCALKLAQSGKCIPILLERGQPVESRGKDIGALIHRRTMNKESNFAFGEGGAGTWSDGKLTTRIGRNSNAVREVLETFVTYGAPAKILIEGSPHLGTDNLVRLLRNMRMDLRKYEGVEVRFGARMSKLHFDKTNQSVTGVDVQYSPSYERVLKRNNNDDDKDNQYVQPPLPKDEGSIERIEADAVVLATGHSARDVYEELHACGVQLEPKGFATGFRVEHPQKIINKIQYGDEWGPNTHSGKKVTDDVNKDYFIESSKVEEDDTNTNDNGSSDKNTLHKGKLPVPSYRLATDKAYDGTTSRGAYSFCMCPGGQIVPASTDPDEVCVNGMSFSRRDSLWANSALVVTVSPDDPILDPYRKRHGVLAGIAFQRDMEQRAAMMGGGNFTVPVQRLTDFVNGVESTSAPSSSYRIGVKPSACHEIYPETLTRSLQDAVVNHFERQMPGFLCGDGLLHGVETRTSSPVRVCRDEETLQAVGSRGLFPAGEGAGFAGGIVSAAVDGMAVADKVLGNFAISKNN